MNDKKYLLNLLGYNVWANEQYFNQAHDLSSDGMTKKCQSLVKNILFSANHLLVINQAWLAYKKAKTRLFEMLQTVLNEELDDLFAAKRKMDKKIYVQKFRRRKNSRRRTGHRQIHTRVRIEKIAGV